MGLEALIIGGIAAAATVGISKIAENNSGSKAAAPAPIPVPQAPNPDDAASKAKDVVDRKRAGMSQTIFTDPLGVGGQANIVRKTLTGQ